MKLLCRKQGLAQCLMDILEEVTESVHRGYFVDLFVRASNAAAIAMYHKVGFQPAISALFPQSSSESQYLAVAGP